MSDGSYALRPHPAKSPDSDISPKTPVPHAKEPADYFLADAKPTASASSHSDDRTENDGVVPAMAFNEPFSGGEIVSSVERSSSKERERKSSLSSSISFRMPSKPSLPQGVQRHTDSGRIRRASPPPQKFQTHVAFDNLHSDLTKRNTPGLTITRRHQGYQANRQSRTFMVGFDDNEYSVHALRYLLDNLVDDGDEVVVVRVLEKEVRLERNYQEEAERVIEEALAQNSTDRAISITLEYLFGKLTATFNRLISVYEPAMLIVGTRGKTSQGLQGMWHTRSSFSKYCLQYSPVPVVVVRPTEKRAKKKEKRAHDPLRHSYQSMLSANQGRHEADSDISSTYELEAPISADEEAHQVAKALGLPSSFDPTIKGINPNLVLHLRKSAAMASPVPSASGEPKRLTAAGSDDEDDDEYIDDRLLDRHKKEKLHHMEVGEAAALKQDVQHSDEDSDE